MVCNQIDLSKHQNSFNDLVKWANSFEGIKSLTLWIKSFNIFGKSEVASINLVKSLIYSVPCDKNVILELLSHYESKIQLSESNMLS
eukprot:jgi/Orpsp1_1/1188973/evm.model.d7180000068607.1